MEYEVKSILDNFMNRTFKPDGTGSIFVTNRNVDLRNVDLWCQMTWFFSDNYFNKGGLIC